MSGVSIIETGKVLDWLESALEKERLAVADLSSVIRLGLGTSCQDCDGWREMARWVLKKYTPQNRVINSPKVINSPSEKVERKGK